MKAMSKQQASAIIDQLEVEERMEAAFNQFIKEGGDAVGPYLDGATAYTNAKTMTAWALTNVGRSALVLTSGWEIAFNACRASLLPDPKWRPASKIYSDLEVTLTARQMKSLYTGEPVTLSAELAADLEKIGGPEGFRKVLDGGSR